MHYFVGITQRKLPSFYYNKWDRLSLSYIIIHIYFLSYYPFILFIFKAERQEKKTKKLPMQWGSPALQGLNSNFCLEKILLTFSLAHLPTSAYFFSLMLRLVDGLLAFSITR